VSNDVNAPNSAVFGRVFLVGQMAVGEARQLQLYWEELEQEFGPFPNEGDYVRIWKAKENKAIHGEVTCVTLAMDTPAICVMGDEGVAHHAFPEFGDSWEKKERRQ